MISFFVRSQFLRISQPLVVADTIDYLEAAFIFQTADWTGASKWAHISQGDKSYKIRLTDDKIRKEDHLNLSAGEWTICLHGDFPNGARITSEPQKITVKATCAAGGEFLPEIPLPEAEQIAAQANRAEQIAQSVRDDADAGKFKGDRGDTGPVGAQGPVGPIGPIGPQGVPGETGSSGPAGAPGPKGDDGAPGPTGPAGADGGYYTPGVRQNSPDTIQFGFWGNKDGMPPVSSGDIPLPPGPAGPTGPRGADGNPGKDGPIGPAGPQGISGVWVGSGAPPAGNKANVLIDPNGAAWDPYALGLTGMSVGDKIEVASVDENGVPTGWKPEGKWELIEEVETKEEAQFVRTTEPNGTPYNFVKIRISILNGLQKNFLNLRVINRSSKNPAGSIQVTEAQNRVYGTVEYKNGYWEGMYGLPVSDDDTKLSFASESFRWFMSNNDPTPINKIMTTTAIQAGVKFKIWAVRA